MWLFLKNGRCRLVNENELRVVNERIGYLKKMKMRERKVNNEMVGENIEIKMVKKIMGIEVNSIEIDEKEKEKRINEKIDIIRKGNMGKGD